MKMSSVNKVILIGRLGRDPEIKTMQSGGKVCNLSVATSEKWKDKATGERKEKTEWHRVVVFNENIIRVCESYLSKGSDVYLEGQIETRKWQDQSGAEKYSTEIVLRPYRGELVLLGSKKEALQENTEYTRPAPVKAAPSVNDFDSDIPF